MRIKRQELSEEEAARLQRELDAAVIGERPTGRICGAHCDAKCRACGARTCQCSCSPFCPDAPSALSSDAMYPIERAIAPLVFEMKRLGLFEPCWSCEGHVGPAGEMQKPPTIWFYVSSLTHVRLLASGIAKLGGAGRLSTPWRISVVYSDLDNPRPTFALEPIASEGADLGRLQRDAYEIATSLAAIMSSEAKELGGALQA